MEDRALKHFTEAWDKIKAGTLFDENINQTFEYMLKNLWKGKYGAAIKSDILKHFPAIYSKSKYSENPPPLFYILISLRDEDINKEMQSLALLDWIKSNATEDSTYQLLNFVQTFNEKGVPIQGFINTIIKRITTQMHTDMVEALAHMITIQHPEYMQSFLRHFLKLADQDDTLLKNYVRMNGRKALVALMGMANPQQMNKILTGIK